MSSIVITRLYDQLSSKLGRDTAENLITFIEMKIEEVVKEQRSAGREDGSPGSGDRRTVEKS